MICAEAENSPTEPVNVAARAKLTATATCLMVRRRDPSFNGESSAGSAELCARLPRNRRVKHPPVVSRRDPSTIDPHRVAEPPQIDSAMPGPIPRDNPPVELCHGIRRYTW